MTEQLIELPYSGESFMKFCEVNGFNHEDGSVIAFFSEALISYRASIGIGPRESEIRISAIE